MLSKTHRGSIVLALIVSLFAGLALVATADDQQPIAKEEKAATEETAAVLENAETPAPQVQYMNGMTISWDNEKKVLAAPTDDQYRAMAERFNEMVKAHINGGIMPAEEEVVIETLGNGLRSARLPARLLSASVVRVDENQNIHVGDCGEGPEATAKLLKAPVQSSQPEEK